MKPGGWTFLSNYGHVLVVLARDPGARMRDIAELVGITERAVQQIVRELVEQGYVRKSKAGRRNSYLIAPDGHLRHELEAGVSLGDFLQLLGGRTRAASRRSEETPDTLASRRTPTAP